MTTLARLRAQPLLIASHNPGKIREIEALLAPFDIRVTSAAEHGLEEPEETGKTFIENARLKSRYCTERTGLPALSDDSGLAVDALDGAPGIYSARWAGPKKDFRHAMERVQDDLLARSVPSSDWSAHFVCALSLSMPDGTSHEFEGTVEGHLIYPPRGSMGFGYDPMFIPDGEARSFGEIPAEEKHRISHRADAFRQLIAAIVQEGKATA